MRWCINTPGNGSVRLLKFNDIAGTTIIIFPIFILFIIMVAMLRISFVVMLVISSVIMLMIGAVVMRRFSFMLM